VLEIVESEHGSKMESGLQQLATESCWLGVNLSDEDPLTTP
jgi:hypothetical protein